MRSLFAFSLALLGAVSPQVSEARSAGCGTSPTSSGIKSMTVNGKTRQYILQLPNNYDSNTAYKLIFGYHWLGGNMQSVADGQYYGLRPLSGDTAIFVAPDGLNNGWANSGGEDVTFTDQMLNEIKGSLCVDETNIFATGWSYGGSMSFSLACSRPNVFKAVAVIAGAQLSGCDGGNTPVPYLGIHGSADNVLPISLGRGLRDKFIGLNGCQSQSAPEPPPGAGNHIKTVYSCNPGFPVWWIAHGGGHVPDPKDSGQGQSWAPGETWSFFTQSGLGGGGGGGPAPSSTSTSTSTASQPTTSTPSTGNCSAKWGQCGGQGWSGPTCCQSGSTCQAQNQWYSQCL